MRSESTATCHPAPLQDIQKILVLRPNAIGDFMFVLPALHALRNAYPEARIVFIGKQWHADFLQSRPSPIDEVAVLPPTPGMGISPDEKVDTKRSRDFVNAMRKSKFDLGLQMYGGGRFSNPFLLSLGARITMGLKTPDAMPLDCWLPYGHRVNRRIELLQVAALAGAAPCFPTPELAVTERDYAAAAALIPPTPNERLVLIHPGASDVRRQWPPDRFAAVADALAAMGATIIISATVSEQMLAHEILAHMHYPALDLSGQLPLPALCGLLARAVMIVANDTGPLHLAISLGTPAVGIFWLTNLLESCPIQQHLLRAALSVQAQCPHCGIDNTRRRCEHNLCFVDDVSAEEVVQMTCELYQDRTNRFHSTVAALAPAPHPPCSRPDPICSDANALEEVPSARYPLG